MLVQDVEGGRGGGFVGGIGLKWGREAARGWGELLAQKGRTCWEAKGWILMPWDDCLFNAMRYASMKVFLVLVPIAENIAAIEQ